MSAAEAAPIYAQLVREQGDVPGEVRRSAEQTLQELEDTVSFRRTASAAVSGELDRTVHPRP